MSLDSNPQPSDPAFLTNTDFDRVEKAVQWYERFGKMLAMGKQGRASPEIHFGKVTSHHTQAGVYVARVVSPIDSYDTSGTSAYSFASVTTADSTDVLLTNIDEFGRSDVDWALDVGQPILMWHVGYESSGSKRAMYWGLGLGWYVCP